MENAPLKFLFTALFEDGTTIEQTPEDVSTIDGTKSTYHDVVVAGKPLVAFILRSTDGSTSAAVSLEDGHFEIDGTVFFVGDAPVARPELVYFRRNFRDFNIGNDQIGHRIHYYIGWKTEDPPAQQVIGLV